MAKNLNRKVTVYINGTEIKSTLASLEAELKKLKNQQKQLTIGTEEYVQTGLKIREIENIIHQQRAATHSLNQEWKSTTERVAEAANILMGFQSAMQMIDLGIGKVKDLAKDAAALDDIYADVMKTTGLTHEQVEKLNEAFKKIDTRTSREELNKLAYEAGKLGINSEEAVAGFVSAADKINIALGDVLGDGAMVTIGKLSDVYAKSTYQLAEAGDDIEKKMLAIGSAINMLGQSSTANENYLVEFLGRLGGVATQAGLSADQILGYASALDQDMQKLEMSATAFQRLIGQMIKKPQEFVRAAKMPLEEFKQLMETDMNAAIKRVLEGFNEMGGYTALVPVFKDMGLDGQRAAAAISSMASSLDKVTEAQAIANEELTTGSSVINEFNTKNETMQAKAEKAKKRFEEVRIELGNELYPVLIHLQKTGTVLMKGIAGFVQLVKENKAILPGLILLMVNWLRVKLLNFAADGKLIKTLTSMLGLEKLQGHRKDVLTAKTLKLVAAKEKERLQTLQNQLAIEKENLARQLSSKSTDVQRLATITKNKVYGLEIAVTEQATKAELAHAAAAKASKAAFASTPWGLIITGLTTVAGLLFTIGKDEEKIEGHTRSLHDELVSAMGESEGKVKTLIDTMRGAEKGSTAYKDALDELKQLYPDIISQHLAADGTIRNLTDAYNDLAAAARRAAYEESRSSALNDQNKNVNSAAMGILNMAPGWAKRFHVDEKQLQEIFNNAVSDYLNGAKDKFWAKNDIFLGLENMGVDFETYEQSANDLDEAFTELTKTMIDLNRVTEMYDRAASVLGDDPFNLKGKSLQFLNEEIRKTKALLKTLTDDELIKKQQRYLAALEKAAAENRNRNRRSAPEYIDEKDVKKWERVKERAERMIADFNTKAESGLLKLRDEIRNKRDQMIKDIEESVGATEEQKQKLIDQVNAAAAAMERSKISQYIKKQREELEKMRRQLKGSNDNEYLNKIEEAERKLLEQIRAIDDSIAAAEEDARHIEEEEIKRLEKKLAVAKDEAVINALKKEIQENKDNLAAIRATIAAYQQLRREFSNNVYHGITDKKKQKPKPLYNDENQWSEATQGKVEEMRGKGYGWLFDEKAFEQYGRALESISAKYEEQEQDIRQRGEAEAEVLQRLTEQRNNAIDTADAENDYNEQLINDLDRQIEEHEANARGIKKEKEELDRLNKEAQDAAKKDAFGKAIDRWIVGIEKFSSAAMEIWGNLNTLLNNMAQSRIQDLEEEKENSVKLLDDQLEQGLISEEEYNEQKEQLDKDYEKREDELNAEIWERNKAYSISEATISAALAILRVWESKGTVAQHIAETALVAANTALQIAAIYNEPKPYAKGGYVERETVYKAGEAGPEWVASNQLLKDPQAAPMISALEAYQRGNRRALSSIPMAALDMPAATAAAGQIGRSQGLTQQSAAAVWEHPTAASVGTDSHEMVKLMAELVKYEKDPRNRQAVISRQTMEDFENNEKFLREHAML